MNHSLTRQISLTEALALLASAAAVIVDSDYVTYAQFPEDDGEGGTPPVLELAQNSEPDSYTQRFTAAANRTVSLTDGRLTMVNVKGEETTLRPLFERHDAPAAKVHTQGVIADVENEGTDFSLFTSTKRITEARLKRYMTKARGLEFNEDDVVDSIILVDAKDLAPIDLDAAEAAL